jgi:hypothetical protein
MATTAATMSNVVGQMFFLATSPLVVTTPDQLPTLWLLQLVPNVALTACMAAFLQDRPPTAPSSAAAHDGSAARLAARTAACARRPASRARRVKDPRVARRRCWR